VKLHHAYSALLSGFSLKELQIFKRNFLAIIVYRDFVLRYLLNSLIALLFVLKVYIFLEKIFVAFLSHMPPFSDLTAACLSALANCGITMDVLAREWAAY